MSEEKRKTGSVPGAAANAAGETGPDSITFHIFGEDAIRVKQLLGLEMARDETVVATRVLFQYSPPGITSGIRISISLRDAKMVEARPRSREEWQRTEQHREPGMRNTLPPLPFPSEETQTR